MKTKEEVQHELDEFQEYIHKTYRPGTLTHMSNEDWTRWDALKAEIIQAGLAKKPMIMPNGMIGEFK